MNKKTQIWMIIAAVVIVGYILFNGQTSMFSIIPSSGSSNTMSLRIINPAQYISNASNIMSIAPHQSKVMIVRFWVNKNSIITNPQISCRVDKAAVQSLQSSGTFSNGYKPVAKGGAGVYVFKYPGKISSRNGAIDLPILISTTGASEILKDGDGILECKMINSNGKTILSQSDVLWYSTIYGL